MNKKILFLYLFLAILILPIISFGAAPTSIPTAIDGIKKLMLGLGTAIVIIGWSIAGILYLVSAGSPEKMGTAKKAIWAAIIGTILVVIAGWGYDVIKAIIENAFGGT